MTKGIDRHSKGTPPPAPTFGGCKPFSRHLLGCASANTPTIAHLLDTLFDLLDDPIVVIDATGNILASNKAWRAVEPLFERSSTPGLASECGYFSLCHAAFCESVAEKSAFYAGITAVVEGREGNYRQEFSSVVDGKRVWYELHASAIGGLDEKCVLLVHRDISALQKLQGDIRESHNLFRYVVENMTDGIFLYDTEGCFKMANSVFADALGLSLHELIGRNIFEVYKPELAQTVHEQNLLVLTTGQTLNFELLLETPKGLRNLHLHKGIYRNHRNEVVGILCISRDITDRREVSESLEKSERHFRALIENGADRVGLLDASGTIRYASPSSKRILGYESEEMIGSDAFAWVHPQDRARVRRRFRELVENPDQVVSAQYRTLHKEGHWQWMEATATNLLHDPTIRAIVLNERNITERKKVETELIRYSDIIKSSNDAILSTDPPGNITSWNPAAQRIFGYSDTEVLGRPVSMLIPSSQHKQHLQFREAALKGKGIADHETQMLCRNGRRIDVSLSLSPLHDEDGQITGCAKIVRDISERRRLEREILEISDREKKRLGQDLHDDLCQHLVGISMVSSVLSENLQKLNIPQADDARNIADLARRAVDHARSLARGLSPLNFEEDGLTTQLEMLVSVTERLFRVPCRFDCGFPVRIRNGDAATHLYRIIQEALHNAVKHSQAQCITVSIAREGSHLLASVIDDGIGFAPGVESRVQESNTPTGLGMHTMQYRAHIIGATLDFNETPGGGTTVVCRVTTRKLGC